MLLTIVLVLASGVLSSCTFIAPYDEKIDDGVSALHGEIIGNLDEEYDAEVYDELLQNVQQLKMRSQAYPKNEHTTEQLGNLSSAIELTEEIHSMGISAADEIALETSLNSIFKSILTLEISKKR